MSCNTSEDPKAAQSEVWAALQTIRSPYVSLESSLHERVGQCLEKAGIPCCHEAVIGKGCRVDFLAQGIAIEIKKGRPNSEVLLRQLRRYAACEGISMLIVISERTVKLPDKLLGKPVRCLALNPLWGVALP